jgi:hypothetical protein
MKSTDLSELIEKRAKEYRFAGDEETYKTLSAAATIIYFEGDKPEQARLRDAVVQMDNWVPESVPQVVMDDNEGLETIPFMTEAFLYPFLGKLDARTLLALWNTTKRAIIELEEYRK